MELVILNALAYVCVFLFRWKRKSKLDPGSLLLGLYSIVAVVSVFLYYSAPNQWKLSLFPFIYLFITSILFFRPYLSLNNEPYNRLKVNNIDWLKIFSLVYIILACITVLFYLPFAISNIRSGDWFNIRIDLYTKDIDLFDNNIKRIITNLSTHLHVAATVIFFYYLTLKKNKPAVTILLGIMIIAPIITLSIVKASRGAFLDLFFLLTICYIIFRNGISKTLRKWLIITLISFITLAIGFSIAVTISRFGKTNQSSSLLYYFGHSMLTFNYGIADSIEKIALGDFFLGNDIDFERLGTHFGVSFYTFIGAWYMDFGPIGTAIIAVIIPFILSKIVGRNKVVNISTIYIYVFYIYYLMRGVFVTPRGYGFSWLIALILFFLLKIKNPLKKIKIK